MVTDKFTQTRQVNVMKIPEYFVKEGVELSKDMTLFGVRMEELSRDELLAGCARGWKMYNDQVQESIRTMDTFAKLKSRM